MHNYKLTIQHAKGSFINSEYFIQRVIYFSKDTSKNEDYSKRIVNYTDIPENIRNMINGIATMFSKTTTVNIVQDTALRVSFLNSNSIVKILKANQISNSLKSNINSIIFYLNNLK